MEDSISGRIKKIGEGFRGLWKSCCYEDGELKYGWSVTFVYGGQYIDSSNYFKTAEEALDDAIDTLKKLKEN